VQLNATPCGFIAKNKQTKPKTHTHTHTKTTKNPTKNPTTTLIWSSDEMAKLRIDAVQEICSSGLHCLLLWLTLSNPTWHKSYVAVWLDLDWWTVRLKKKKQQNSVSERILTKLDILSVKALWEPWIQTQELFSIIISESRLGIRAGRVMWSEN